MNQHTNKLLTQGGLFIYTLSGGGNRAERQQTALERARNPGP